jgi:Rieske Fe-S protein
MQSDGRRSFFKWTFGIVSAALAATIGSPIIAAFLSPIYRRTVREGTGPIDCGKIDALQLGIPVKVDVVTTRVDAWDRSEPQAVGAVWLVRRDAGRVDAYCDVCPHLGCAIDFSVRERVFKCPCHESAFALEDGARLKGPSPRGLDPLPVELKSGSVVVTHKRFVQGIAARKES